MQDRSRLTRLRSDMKVESFGKKTLGVLKVFVPAFLFFVVVGGIAGYNARQEVVLEMLMKDIEVRKKEGAYVFEYDCSKNNLTFIYSVDNNSGKYVGDVPALLSYQMTALTLPTERYTEYRTLISSILGGVTGGVRLRALLKKPQRGWTWAKAQKAIKNNIIGIIGSITGYYAGYKVGSHYNTDCDSELVLSVLQDSELQLRLERARLAISMLVLENLEGAVLSQTGRAIYAWDQNPAFICSPELDSAKSRIAPFLEEQITDPTSIHFHVIDDISDLYTKISNTPEYRTLVENQIYKHADHLNRFKESNGGLGKHANEKEKEWDRACSIVATMVL